MDLTTAWYHPIPGEKAHDVIRIQNHRKPEEVNVHSSFYIDYPDITHDGKYLVDLPNSENLTSINHLDVWINDLELWLSIPDAMADNWFKVKSRLTADNEVLRASPPWSLIERA